MATRDKINELNQIRKEVESGGGKVNIEKQHKKGKQTARERIEKLFDKGSFSEFDTFIETRCIEFDMQNK